MEQFKFEQIVKQLVTPPANELQLKLKRTMRPFGDPEALLFYSEGLELSQFPEFVFFLGKSSKAYMAYVDSPAETQRLLEKDLTTTVLPMMIQIWSFIRKDGLPLSQVIWQTTVSLSLGTAVMRFASGEDICNPRSALYPLLLSVPAVFATLVFEEH
jgi:hypothetical protein